MELIAAFFEGLFFVCMLSRRSTVYGVASLVMSAVGGAKDGRARAISNALMNLCSLE